jgi:K+ transporter
MTEPPEQFLKHLQENKIVRVPGTAIFLTRIAEVGYLDKAIADGQDDK